MKLASCRSGPTGWSSTHKLRLWVPSVLSTPPRLTAAGICLWKVTWDEKHVGRGTKAIIVIPDTKISRAMHVTD